MILTNGGADRFPTRSGAALPGGIELKANEVDAILDASLITASRARGAIRQPLGSQAHVSIWVVDTQGTPIGFTRSFDAPVFGIDVALQKGRTAAFYSSNDAGARLIAGGFSQYVANARTFLGAAALTGQNAFTDRAGGNLSRPFFPDGIDGDGPGPFSLPFPGTSGSSLSWSPFNDGLQLDLVLQRLVAALGGSISGSCSDVAAFSHKLANGIQVFPGSVPLYRGHTLIGGLGVSGDGVDQDDLISFYGASRPGLDFAGHTDVGDPTLGFDAPQDIRADQLTTLPYPDVRLRYVNCPQAPFNDTNDQNVCDGL